MRRFALFLLVLLLIAALLRIDFFFTIVYLLVGVYLLSHLWLWRAWNNTRFERRFVNHAFFGDQVEVDLVVRNKGWLPALWLNLHDSLPVQIASPPFHHQVISLNARETRCLRYTLHCRRRGYYAVGPLTFSAGDILGIVPPRAGQLAPENLVVYPKIVPLHQLNLPTRSPQVALPARSPLFEDPSRVMGVRDYTPGDSPRRIHWTATASAGRMLVKQYQPAIAREMLICLDLNQENYGSRQQYTATELAIVAAASLANHVAVEENLPVGLTTDAWDSLVNDRVRFFLPPRTGRAHLIGVLEVLARVQKTPAVPLGELLRRGSMNLSWGATLTVITGRESETLFDNLVYVRRAGFAVTLILVQSARHSKEMQQRADLLGMPIYRMWQESDLEQW